MMVMTFKILLILCIVCIISPDIFSNAQTENNMSQASNTQPVWDTQGYVFFCLCMGRFGNQADHFLGGLAFAKALNRTLVLPPFRTYRNVRFTEWFKVEPIQSYHKAILAEDFMKYLAPKYWPQKDRIGFCWLPDRGNIDQDCRMKEGNPFGPFWDGLGVDFERSIVYHISYYDTEMEKWRKQFPAEKYPVLAFRGAPAHYPIFSHHRHLQQHLVFSDRIENQAKEYIDSHFPNKTFVGIHLRNGADWVHACGGVKNIPFYMASPQCLEGTDKPVTSQMCYPDETEILRLTKEAVIETSAEVVFVATDKYPMIDKLENHLKEQNVKVFHADPHLPVTDLAILVKADHFVGNCVSSFTAYVKRARDVQGKPTTFFGFS